MNTSTKQWIAMYLLNTEQNPLWFAWPTQIAQYQWSKTHLLHLHAITIIICSDMDIDIECNTLKSNILLPFM